VLIGFLADSLLVPMRCHPLVGIPFVLSQLKPGIVKDSRCSYAFKV